MVAETQRRSPNSLDEMREEPLGRLLSRVGRVFNEKMQKRLRELGHEGLTVSHIAALASIDLDGTRVTTLGDRLDVSKQAAAQTVAELEAQGYIQRINDPQDKRALLIIYTEGGWRFLVDSYQARMDVENEYRLALGDEMFDELRAGLLLLLNPPPPKPHDDTIYLS